MIDLWRSWIDAFDTCVDEDNWGRLSQFLAEDFIYAVQGPPFACKILGRELVFAGFAKSKYNFDRRFDERKLIGVGIREWGPSAVPGRALGLYRLGH